MKKTPSQYGLWPSPISPKALAQDKRLSEVQWDSNPETGYGVPPSSTLVWLEGRGDRNVLVASDDGGLAAPRDLTSDSAPPPRLPRRGARLA